MALSMTGCGSAAAAEGATAVRVEIRGVNGRQFKMTLRASEGLAALEPRIEAVVRRRVERGTVHVAVVAVGPAVGGGRRIDLAQLGAYLDDLESFAAARGLPVPQSADAVLGLPGVVTDAGGDAEAAERAWPLVERALAGAVDAFDRMRRDEGAMLATEMRAMCGDIAGLVDTIRDRVPEVVIAYRDRLLERVAHLLTDRPAPLAEGEVAREVALIADRTDVTEELVRLRSHLDQFSRLLDEESPGRSLDFLAQELGREANTIASKSLDVAIAHAVVEIKTRIERLREQAQNIA